MIKFFRKIRYNLMEGNKTGKYFKYAIGEIVLVVIGILIALSINNWNQSNNQSKKELDFLVNIKSDLNSDIATMIRHDSTYAKYEDDAEIGMKLFYKAKTIKDIESVSTLTHQLWNELYINQNTYNEMINSGNMYSMKNKGLKESLMNYYSDAEAYKYYFRQIINEQSQLYVRTPEMNPYKFLISQFKNTQIDFSTIDTTWINNPKSATYLAIITYLNSNQEYNIVYRRGVYRKSIISAKNLIISINEELEDRNK